MPREIPLRIDAHRCQSCQPCLALKACKVRALVRLDPDEPPYLDTDRCYDCRLCVLACPHEAIRTGQDRLLGG